MVVSKRMTDRVTVILVTPESIADAPMRPLEAEVTLALADLSGALLDHPLLTRETVRERLANYHSQTAPLLPFYREKGLLSTVDGMADMDGVTQKIEAVLGALTER